MRNCTEPGGCIFICIQIVRWIPVLVLFAALTWGYYAYVLELCIYQASLMAKCLCPKNLETAAGRAQQLFWPYERVISSVEMSNSVIQCFDAQGTTIFIKISSWYYLELILTFFSTNTNGVLPDAVMPVQTMPDDGK
uniref:Innexin n=1 Tax=Heterorhabditis bacteriophora TaxID=37862 RepID=A0A1I7WUS4_HETBA